MEKSNLGRVYNDGDIIVKEGEPGDSMYVVQFGSVILQKNKDGKDVFLARLAKGDFFGEMAVFEQQARSATVIAKGEVYVLTVDKRTLLSRIQEDPPLPFLMLEKISARLREMDAATSLLQ